MKEQKIGRKGRNSVEKSRNAEVERPRIGRRGRREKRSESSIEKARKVQVGEQEGEGTRQR